VIETFGPELLDVADLARSAAAYAAHAAGLDITATGIDDAPLVIATRTHVHARLHGMLADLVSECIRSGASPRQPVRMHVTVEDGVSSWLRIQLLMDGAERELRLPVAGALPLGGSAYAGYLH